MVIIRLIIIMMGFHTTTRTMETKEGDRPAFTNQIHTKKLITQIQELTSKIQKLRVEKKSKADEIEKSSKDVAKIDAQIAEYKNLKRGLVKTRTSKFQNIINKPAAIAQSTESLEQKEESNNGNVNAQIPTPPSQEWKIPLPSRSWLLGSVVVLAGYGLWRLSYINPKAIRI